MEILIMEQFCNKDCFDQDKDVIAPLYGKASINFVKGEGSYLFDADGHKYLDFVSGIAVNALGHAFPAIVNAIQEQAAKFTHVSNLYPNEPQVKLARKLLAGSPYNKAFFSNSGTEANEGAIKFARKYFNRIGEPDRVQIVTFFNSFHGRTFGALSATGQPSLQEGFGSMPGGFSHVAWNDTSALKAMVNEKTCAIMLEPLAAEGGVLTISPEMVTTINDLRHEFGCLVITDEIQTGMGRLGLFFGSEIYGIKADIITMAKAIGAGLPLGATLMTSKVANTLKAGDHGTTFGGNPIACAAGLVVVNEIKKPLFLEALRTRSQELKAGLEKLSSKYSFLGDVRGEGLLLGLCCEKPVAEIINLARQEGLLIHRAGANVLRFLPPLNVSAAEVEEALAKLDRTFAKVV
jgi:predicted acetylornithine/succinylornithine family transaminase